MQEARKKLLEGNILSREGVRWYFLLDPGAPKKLTRVYAGLMSHSDRRGIKFVLRPKLTNKNRKSLSYPSAKGRRRLKPICLAMNFRGASASDVQTCTAPPKQALCWNNFRGVDEQLFCQKKFSSTPRIFFFNKVPVLEKLCRFTRNYRMQLENSLPDM